MFRQKLNGRSQSLPNGVLSSFFKLLKRLEVCELCKVPRSVLSHWRKTNRDSKRLLHQLSPSYRVPHSRAPQNIRTVLLDRSTPSPSNGCACWNSFQPRLVRLFPPHLLLPSDVQSEDKPRALSMRQAIRKAQLRVSPDADNSITVLSVLVMPATMDFRLPPTPKGRPGG